MNNDGWLRLCYGIAVLLTFFKMNLASKANEENSPELVKLQYGEATTDFVESSHFLALQYVKSSLSFTPEMKTIDVSSFLGLEDVLLLDDLLDEFVPSTSFPANPADYNDSTALFQAHENILRFALYSADHYLMTRLAEKFFGFIHPETRDDFLRLVFNCKENDEDSAYVFRMLFLKQAEMVSTLSSIEQGLFLSTFSGLVPADIDIFKLFSLNAVKCFRLEEHESEWTIDGNEFILGNGCSQDDWKLEIKEGNRHLEIALLLIQPDFSRDASNASSFFQVLSSFRRGFKAATVKQHISNAIRCACEMDLLDLIVEWLDIIKSQKFSLYSMLIELLKIGIEKNNLEFTSFASDRLNNEPIPRISEEIYDPILCAIDGNTSIEVFEALFPFALKLWMRTGTNHLEAAIKSGRSDIALLLLEKGADPNQQCTAPSKLTHWIHTRNAEPFVLTLAIKMGLFDVVEGLLLCGATVHQMDFEASFGNIEMLDFLYESRGDIFQSLGHALLESAALSGHLDTVLFLESKGMKYSLCSSALPAPSQPSNVGVSLGFGSSFLGLCHQITRNIDPVPSNNILLGKLASKGSAEILIHFLDQEDDLSQQMLEEIWSNALFNCYRFQTGKCSDIIKYLNSRSDYFPRYAIKNSLASIPSEILELLFDIFSNSFLALSPLHDLLSLNRGELVNNFLQKRLDLIHSLDSSGRSLFSIKTQPDWLYDLDYEFNLPSDALFTALSDQRYKDCDRLSKETSQYTYIDEDGRNLLHVAASVKNIKGISFILDNFEHFESLVNQPDNSGDTCLHYAVQKRNAALVSFLIENNADIHQKNIFLKSPLQLAIKDREIYQLFINSDSFKLKRKRENDEMSENPNPTKRQKAGK